MTSTSASSAMVGQNGARVANINGGGERVFNHVQDLQDKAKDGYDPQAPIGPLLDIADRGLNQAQTLVGFRRPDLAFVEYIRALEIILNIIPRHKDFPNVKYDRPGHPSKFRILLKQIKEVEEQYVNIKEIIHNNNLRHGTQPGSAARNAPRTSISGATVSPINGTQNMASGQNKIKPTPSPKPDKLQGRTVKPIEALDDRFAQLGIGAVGEQASAPVQPLSTMRPQGPRAMPSIDTNTAFVMPQEPKAAYSPARNMQVAGGIAPPRHSARSLASTSTRKSSLVRLNSTSSTISNGTYRDSPSTNSVNGSHSSTHVLPGKRRALYDPRDAQIEPQQLFDYLELYNVLLIDFRPRNDFVQGHVYYRSVICVEPFTLRQGMSADELADSLIVSPDYEQSLFSQRDEFDLVVYYDQSTSSNAYLEQPSTRHESLLKCLHEALCDFNQDKPLRRPPILLTGGVEAWVELVGQQALASFDVVSRTRPSRSTTKRDSVSVNAYDGNQLRVSKRRYNPLGEEEEKNWRERARAESVVLPQPTEADDLHDSGLENDDENSSAIREFLARFPEAGKLTDREFFAGTMPERRAPEPPTRVPVYPPAPHPSDYQSPPTRPMPAAPRMSYNGVSDRAVSAVAPTNRSVGGTPYIPSKYLDTNFRLPKTGLVNFGNTCYMNSTVQALSATTPLSVFFLEDAFRGQIQRSNWRSNSKGVMAELYSNLVRSLWKGDVEVIRPTTFRKFCGRAYQLFESDGVQQDAKEFFDFFLDCLHEDLNLNWSRTPLRALTDAEEAKREQMPELVVAKLEWDRYLHRDFSFVQGLFGGQHLSKLTCKTCGFTSSKYEYFSSISVEIPSDPRKWRNGRLPSLEDCLRSFCTEETLTGEEAWICSRCKVARESSKRITITRAPQTLVIHFKRFDNNGNNTRKVRTPVDFPLENLDLSPYMLPPPSNEEAQAIGRDYGADYLKTDASMTPPYLYDALAVIRHIGPTLGSGHYITAVKDRARQKWRWYNDTRVNEFNPQDLTGSQSLQNEEAYIVFYQRVQAAGKGGKI